MYILVWLTDIAVDVSVFRDARVSLELNAPSAKLMPTDTISWIVINKMRCKHSAFPKLIHLDQDNIGQ